jgi:hypothetical protein
MKKLLVAFAIVGAGTAGLAEAQQPSFYAGADLVNMTQKNKDESGILPDLSGTATTTNLRLKGGIHALDWLDAELQVIVPQTGSYSAAGAGDVSFRTSVTALFAKPNTNLGPVNVYGLVGFASISQTHPELSVGLLLNRALLSVSGRNIP